MTTTPTLPPYPEPDIIDGEPHWFDRHMDAYALAAHQAGRQAGYAMGYQHGIVVLRQYIADNAYAASFQTMGQYRQALLKHSSTQRTKNGSSL